MKSLKVLYGSLKARIRKTYVLVAAAAVGAFLLLGILVPYFISGEEVKSKIISHVNQFSTHRLEINGSVEIEGFPFPKMQLTDVTLFSPNKFGDIAPLLAADTVEVDLSFLSMITGSVEPTSITINNPAINLYVNEDGEENWTIDNSQSNLRINNKQDEGKKRGANSYVDDMLNSIPLGLLYSDIVIKNGTVQYDNHKTGSLLVIEEYQQLLSMDGLDNEMSVVGSGLWNGEKSEWNVMFSSIRYLLSKHRTKVNAKIYNSLAAFNSKGHIENGIYKGNMILTVPSVRKMAHWIKQESFLQGFPSKVGLNINGNQLECAQSSCSVANANFKIEKIQGTTSFTWRYGSKIPFLDLELNTNKANLTPLLLHYMEHKKFEEESDAIEAFNETLANEFNDPLVEIDSPKNTAPAEKGWSSEPFNWSYLSDINANIKIGIKESLKLGKLEFGRAQFSVKLQDGYLSAQIANAEIYKGNANIRLKLDSKATPATWNLSTNINAMDALQLLSYFTEFRFLQGLGTLHADVASQGNSMHEVVRNLQGNGLMLVNDGRIKGVNLASMFRSNDEKLLLNLPARSSVLILRKALLPQRIW
jgi:AsmA protein